MTQNLNYIIQQETGRIDKVLPDIFKTITRNQFQNWLKSECISVNGKFVKPNYKVQHGDNIVIVPPEPENLDLVAEKIDLDIVYEDNDVIVVNKPQGMVVHPSVGHTSGTLVNALLYHAESLSSINDVIRPGIVHRIDKDTSGLLMVAKNDEAHLFLSNELKNRKSLRQYIALVHGNIPHDKGEINAPIGRSKTNRQKMAVIEEGKEAITHFKVLERFDNFTLVECQLETGRTHQIRVHMDYIGYPIAGDPVYGPKKTLPSNGQFLHAKTLGFCHPQSGKEMTFEAPLPKIFEDTLIELRTQKDNH